MLDKNSRIIIEAIRNAKFVTIKLNDECDTSITVTGGAPREIAMALQHHLCQVSKGYDRHN